MGNESFVAARHEAYEAQRAKAEQRTKEKRANVSRTKPIYQTNAEIYRFHGVILGGIGKIVVTRRQKNCKRFVRGQWFGAR
jgi:hypothetical protein